MNDRPRKSLRDPGGMLEIVAIAGFIAALLFGGLKLLADTHVAFDARAEAKAERAASVRQSVMEAERALVEQRDTREEARQALDAIRAERQRLADAANTRCIGGTLFRIEGNSYTNIGTC